MTNDEPTNLRSVEVIKTRKEIQNIDEIRKGVKPLSLQKENKNDCWEFDIYTWKKYIIIY